MDQAIVKPQSADQFHCVAMGFSFVPPPEQVRSGSSGDQDPRAKCAWRNSVERRLKIYTSTKSGQKITRSNRIYFSSYLRVKKL